METDRPDYLTSFGRRRGRKLKPGKQHLMDHLLPRVRLAPGEIPSLDRTGIIAEKWWVEIGYGGGEHLAAQANAHPEIGMIGCEPYVNGIAGMLEHIDHLDLKNIRLVTDDARALLDALPPASLARIFVLFPDPWRKARHHKRRLISLPTLEKMARVLKPNGLLRLATDHADYSSWMLEQLLASPHFDWTAKTSADWQHPPPDWVPTRYEAKARAQGRMPVYYDFIRNRNVI